VLTERLTALGRAHDLVRPLPGDEGKAALLGDILSVLLAPYDDQGLLPAASGSPFLEWESANEPRRHWLWSFTS
jgi:hypothetical protein